MNMQSAQRSELGTAPPHIHFGLETCPTCGQEIPPDKVEEIRGKVAAREREQALAVAAQLEQQFAAQRTRADAKAKADLEAERQQGAARETRAREEAKKAAEKLMSEKQAEADEAHAAREAGWRQQLADVESARKLAQETEANLQVELKRAQEAGANALEAAKAEAKERELEIQNKATQAAESAATERIEAFQEAQRESEAGLEARIKEAEACRAAAEQKETALALQFEQERAATEAQMAREREEAAAAAELFRLAATETAELRHRDALAEMKREAADANAKALEAEQRAAATEESMRIQREALDKDKEAAVNSERAKAFDENQKLTGKVNELQRALEKKSAEELGEGAEIDLYEALRTEFPEDKIARIPKGTPGADIRHIVMLQGQKCGTILYDSKNHKQFRNDHVTKLRTDQLAERAEHAVLSTHKFPQGAGQIHHQDGVILANPARVVSIAMIFRSHLQQLYTLRLSGIERESKMAALYEFITSVHCTGLLGRIDEQAEKLLEQQTKEVRWHENNWKSQGETIRQIQRAKADLSSRISSIIGASTDLSAISEAS